MGNLVKRSTVCERLRVSTWHSYQLVFSSYGKLVNTDSVVELLNNCSRGEGEPLLMIPSDLLTPDEMAAELQAAGNEITAADLLRWTHRTKAVPPHFRLSAKTIRFSRSRLMAWLDERSRNPGLKTKVA